MANAPGKKRVHNLPISLSHEPTRMSRADLISDPLQRSKQLLQKIRRAKTDQEYDIAPFEARSFVPLPEKDYVDTHQLRVAVFNVIKQRLQKRNIDTSQLTEAAISWCLPKSWKQQETWMLLLNHPLQTTADLVNSILSLKPATPDTKPQRQVSKVETALSKPIEDMAPDELLAYLLDSEPSAKHKQPGTTATVYSYYIRTFHIRVKELQTILEALDKDGFGAIEQVESWSNTLEDLPILSYVTLRYCGFSHNPPWDRHVQDIYSTTATRFIVRFFRRVASQCQHVLVNATVQTVNPITTTLKLSRKDVDLHEMVLIALFGDGTLNIEVGGKSSMVLTEKDHTTYLNLGSSPLVYNKARSDSKGLLYTDLKDCPESLSRAVRDYAKAVRQYVEASPSTTGKYEFNDQTEEIIASQAMPAVLKCSPTTSVLVILGSDFGELLDNRVVWFFQGHSRSSAAIADCLNHFATWDRPVGAAYDPMLTKSLATEHRLPFVDLFAWFTRDAKDYMAARTLLNQYMLAARPLVVLTLGELQTFAMTTPIKNFSKKAFDNTRRDAESVDETLGIPVLSSYDGSQEGSETVVIPCIHPAHLQHIGKLKDELQALLSMILAIAWQATHLAITITKSDPNMNRKVVCERIIGAINKKLSPGHAFGKAFLQAKRRFNVSREKYWAGRALRGKAAEIPPVPSGILPTITEHIRQGRVTAATTLASGVGGFEVKILIEETDGPKQDSPRISLEWDDYEHGKTWKIGPVLLPTGVVPSGKKDKSKRYIFFVPNGIDIRNSAGESLGARKAIASGNSKTETLAIASIVLSMSESDELPEFLAYWEDVVGVKLDTLWASSGAGASSLTAQYFPAIFFADSATQHALPFTQKSLKPDTFTHYLKTIKDTLPANTGDLLWLVDRFLAEKFASGGDIDLAAGSEVTTSVYHIISRFCSQPTYKFHPHLRTFRALVSVVEQGADERMIATNALMFAFQVLRTGFQKRQKSLKLKVNGQTKESKRFVATVGRSTPKNVICDWVEPDLESVAQVISDEFTVEDDEASDEEALLSTTLAAGPSAPDKRKISADSAAKTTASSSLKRSREHDDDDEEMKETRSTKGKKISRTTTIGGSKDK